jgi:hypothetical protein
MHVSLRALLTGMIDYAGLFPPAQLPLEEALRNDAAYRQGSDAWMLGRFVCPSTSLSQLMSYPPLSVVGRGGKDLKEFLIGLRDDLGSMLALRGNRPAASIETYEVRLCGELLTADSAKNLRTVLYGSDDLLASGGVVLESSFYEVEYKADWFGTIGFLIGALIESPDRKKGLKIRCGGGSAAAVPSVDDLAFGMVACRKTGIPVKFTAGLHHPLRRDDKALGAKTHGFLNVFVAGVLCHARGLELEAVQAILEDEDPHHFRFDDTEMWWKDLHATTEEVRVARSRFVTSFGSCSFDEPREDLRALRLMD